MATPLFRPVKRFRGKTTRLTAYGMEAQEFLPSEVLHEDVASKQQVYLVTCPHPIQDRASSGEPLRQPNAYSHQALLDALLDACASPVYGHGNAARGFGGVRLRRCVVAAEYHKAGADGQANRHYHVAVQAFASFRFVAIKRALLGRHGIATHWSTTHLGYWSALSYIVKASAKKPASCLDPRPLPWHFEGVKENLSELAARPTTASSLEARREKAVEQAETSGKAEPRPSEIDIWPVVVRHNIRNDEDGQSGAE